MPGRNASCELDAPVLRRDCGRAHPLFDAAPADRCAGSALQRCRRPADSVLVTQRWPASACTLPSRRPVGQTTACSKTTGLHKAGPRGLTSDGVNNAAVVEFEAVHTGLGHCLWSSCPGEAPGHKPCLAYWHSDEQWVHTRKTADNVSVLR